MNQYGFSVYDEEFGQALQPSAEEWATTAQALGMALKVYVPPLECLNAVREMTSNPRIRQVLEYTYCQTLRGEDVATAFVSSGKSVDEHFIAALYADIQKETAGAQLLQYAIKMGVRPHQVAEQFVRNEAVQKFTTALAELELPLLRACYLIKENSGKELQTILDVAIDCIESGRLLSDALHSMYPQIFDRLYVSMIRSGEAIEKLDEAFNLLAKS